VVASSLTPGVMVVKFATSGVMRENQEKIADEGDRATIKKLSSFLHQPEVKKYTKQTIQNKLYIFRIFSYRQP